MTTSEIPELKLPDTSSSAFICLSRFDWQGIIEHKNVSHIWVSDRGLLNVQIVGTDALYRPHVEDYDVESIWGAWLGWPYKTYRRSSGLQQMGPEFFFDVVWDDWEWSEPNGSKRKRRMINPVKSSIWCDRAETGPEIMTTVTNLGYSDWHIMGWVRKSRVRSHKLVANSRHPSMPGT